MPGTTNLVVQPINYRRAKKIIDQLAQINGKDLEFGDGVRDRISITRGMKISDRRGFDTSGGQYFLPDFN